MNLASRAIPGTGLLRPQPVLFQSEDGKTIGIITNWGTASASELVIEKLKSFLAPKAFDPDVTQVKAIAKPVESPIETRLSVALHEANESIYKAENEKVWKTVIEVAVIHVDRGVLYWAQAGCPHLLMSLDPQSGGGVEFLCLSPDASSIFNQPIPLPMSGLGLDLFPNVSSGSVSMKSGVKLALLSVPGKALPLLSQSPFTVEDLTNALSFSFPHQPAWVGVSEVD